MDGWYVYYYYYASQACMGALTPPPTPPQKVMLILCKACTIHPESYTMSKEGSTASFFQTTNAETSRSITVLVSGATMAPVEMGYLGEA